MASVRRMKRSYYLFGIGGPLLFTALPLVLAASRGHVEVARRFRPPRLPS